MARAVSKKTTSKAPATQSKTIKKDPKSAKASTKKAGIAGKVSQPKSAVEGKLLEVALLLDTTGSMMPWIHRAKKTLNEIISNVVSACDGSLKVRVCFVGYNDYGMTPRYSLFPFTDDTEKLKDWITKNVKTVSGIPTGNDWPEDVAGGLRKCLDQAWTPGSAKQVFHIFDAPGHGTQYHPFNMNDRYPKGDPDGHVIEDLMEEFYNEGIEFTVVKLESFCQKMIDMMKAKHPNMQVTDLDKASKTKSDAEISKMFVDSASFILKATVGANGKKITANYRKGQKPLWDTSKLAVDEWFSNIAYLKVTDIDGNKITVKNHHGTTWHVSKDILSRDMYSADHFAQTVKCNMTDLYTILESIGDTIFKICFKKKVDEKSLAEELASFKPKDLTGAGSKALMKSLLEGDECEMVCHRVESENLMGRSLVIDLNAIGGNNFRQVDHRTIQWIVYKNVKYVLGKKDHSVGELPLKVDYTKPKWDEKELTVGDWLSQIQHYKVSKIVDKDTVQVVTNKDPSKAITMSRDILEYEMYSAGIFQQEEKITRTNLIEILLNAKDCCFKIKFHRKVDEAHVKEILESVTKAQLSGEKKELSKEMTTGKEVEFACFLSRSEGNLGRSNVISLEAPDGKGFRQVDHRTVKYMVLKNVKYIIK